MDTDQYQLCQHYQSYISETEDPFPPEDSHFLAFHCRSETKHTHTKRPYRANLPTLKRNQILSPGNSMWGNRKCGKSNHKILSILMLMLYLLIQIHTPKWVWPVREACFFLSILFCFHYIIRNRKNQTNIAVPKTFAIFSFPFLLYIYIMVLKLFISESVSVQKHDVYMPNLFLFKFILNGVIKAFHFHHFSSCLLKLFQIVNLRKNY